MKNWNLYLILKTSKSKLDYLHRIMKLVKLNQFEMHEVLDKEECQVKRRKEVMS